MHTPTDVLTYWLDQNQMLTIIHGVKCISCHNTYQLKYTVTNTHVFPVSVKVLPGILVPTVVPGVTVLVCCRKTVREKKTLSALSNYISETDYSQKSQKH